MNKDSFNVPFLLKDLFLLSAALFVAFLLGRWYEFGLLAFSHGWEIVDTAYIAFALIYDLQISLLLAPLVLLLLSLLNLILPRKIKQGAKAFLITAVGAVYILLVSYYSSTLSPLGAEFWAYSATEMTNTVIAAEQITFFNLALFLGLCSIIYLLSRTILSLDVNIYPVKKNFAGFAAVVILIFILPAILQEDDHFTFTKKEKQSNKLAYFMKQSLPFLNLSAWRNKELSVDEEYPLLRKAASRDVLGPYFEAFDTPPNIVFLLVESLGGEFVGPNGQWSGFAPTLDSLSQKSLYWKNGLSLSGRTFGFVPSLLGSLPFGKHGFMELGPNYPSHESLISLLDKQGYYTAFYSGYDTYFDGLEFFLEYQGIDYILNKQKMDSLLPESRATQNYWGVDDKTMLNFASSLLDTAETFPRLEIYHTLQSHSPFNVPDPEKYEKQFDRRLAALNLSPDERQSYQRYRSELTSLMFADQAIHDFMQAYRKRDHFDNTIFIITGDHWLIPVPQSTVISRYHVPIIIYSPKLKEPVYFESVNTHAEIVPTLTALLNAQSSLTMPDSVHWIGGLMDTSRQFQSKQAVPLMRNKNQISDYLDGQYYLYGDEVYELSKNLMLTQIKEDEIKSQVISKLEEFKAINSYVTENDKLYPGKPANSNQKYAFMTEYDSVFSHIDSLGLSTDQQFEWAREAAFDGNYEVARAVAKRILLSSPNYHDVRILIGRTYAWEQKYELAQTHFKEVLNSEDTYYDVYNAYFDNEYWSGDYRSALDIINRGLEKHPDRNDFIERKIKVLSALKKFEEVKQVYDDLKRNNPDYQNLKDLEKYLSE